MVIRLLVEGRVEGECDVALDVVDVVDEDGLSGMCHVAGDGCLVDGKRGPAGDVLVLRLAAEKGVVLHEAEVQEAAGRQVDGPRIRHQEPPRLRENAFQQGVQVLDREKRFDCPKQFLGVALHTAAFTPHANASRSIVGKPAALKRAAVQPPQ